MMIKSEKYLEGFSPPESNRLYQELSYLHGEIHKFSNDLNDIKPLLVIQNRLVIAVIDAEKEIKEAKNNNTDPREWQYIRYNFLCLGDSLAFLFADRFSLKQTYFNVNNTEPKQSGGFISGKKGFKNEMMMLVSAIENNVPAVLCDLTNVIRYGDICLLGSGEPVMIEVKSSNTRDSRSKRQKKKKYILENFFNTDRAQDFRGLKGETVRVECSEPPRSFGNLLEENIAAAIALGSSRFEVDGCLEFYVFAGESPDYDEIFKDTCESKNIFGFVNSIKSNMMWGCYFPYALTISNSLFYEKFIRGEFYIIFNLNTEKFESNLNYLGSKLEIECSEESFSCSVYFDRSNGVGIERFIIGEHMLNRMWSDFLYPSWIVKNSIDNTMKCIAELEIDKDTN